MTKRLPRRPESRIAPRWDITKLLTKPPSKGGPIRQPRVPSRLIDSLRRPEAPVQFEFGSAVRSPGARRNVARGLPGFSFDLHAPDPNRGELVWVEMRINWFFNGWKSEWPRNDKSTSVRFEGSVDWYWFLTGHPQFFDKAPILLTDGGHFSFYTSIPPGGRGFDVGWICPARSGIFTNVPDKQDERNLSPLDRLLSLQVGNVLKLWFAMDTRRASPEARHDPWGADRIDWVYAYLVQDQPRR